MDDEPPLKQAFRMKEGTTGAVLRAARLAKDKALREVGAAVGVTPQAVGQWEKDKPITMPHLIAVCLFLEIDPTAATEGRLVPRENPGLAPPDATLPVDVGHPEFGPRDVEVRGVAVGGDDADFYFNGEAINMVARPPGLARAKHVFAINIVGESMVNHFYPGDLAYCQPVPAAPGDYVVVEMHPEHEGEAGKAFVKRLKKREGGKLLCEQHNPQKDVTFDLALVKAVYRIIPLKEMMS